MQRQHYIDWLRVMTMLGVFVFHCVRFFDKLPWHLKNPEQSDMALIFVGFMNGWFMELFFLLSGFAAWFALKNRSLSQFAKERVLRLLLPIYTVGLFIILPPQRWWDLQTLGREVGGFLEYYPIFITTFGSDVLSPFFLSPWPAHLWFLRFLFMISLLALPVMLWLKSKSGQKALDRLVSISNLSGGIWLLLPLVIFLRTAFPAAPGDHNWNVLLTYALYFLIGYVLAARPVLSQSFRDNLWYGLALGLLAFGGIGVMALGGLVDRWNPAEPVWKVLTWDVISAVNTWAMLIFVLGAGHRWLDRPSPILNRLNEAVLPFYILHQTAILYVGWWIGPLNWSIPAKLLFMVSASLALTVLSYEFLIRPWNQVRFLFGMRPKQN